MAAKILTKKEAQCMSGRMATFSSDKLIDEGCKFFDWRSGDACFVGGYVEFPDRSPCLMVFYGDDFMGVAEIELPDFFLNVNFSTGLATADRRQHGGL